jgi:predicted transcriptional regulator
MTNKFMKVNKDLFTLGLTPIEILILAQVMEFDTNTGNCFISDKALAEQFGVSEKTISRAMTALEGKGFITRSTKNVKGGRERHIAFNRGNVEKTLTTDKMTVDEGLQQTKCPLTTDNLTLAKGQNDFIKDNIKDKEKDNMGIDEYSLRFATANSSIPTTEPQEYKEVSKREMLALGVPHEVIDAEKSLYKILATNKIVKAV